MHVNSEGMVTYSGYGVKIKKRLTPFLFVDSRYIYILVYMSTDLSLADTVDARRQSVGRLTSYSGV